MVTDMLSDDEKYRIFFENASDFFYSADTNGFFTAANKTLLDLLGYSSDELIGSHISKILTRENMVIAQKMISLKLNGHTDSTSYEIEIQSKDGRMTPVELASKTIYKDGKRVGIQGIGRDIQERKRNALQHKQWLDAFNHAALGIGLGDATTNNVLACNPAYASMLGYTVEELQGYPIFRLYDPLEHEYINHVISEISKVGIGYFESRMVRKDGTSFPVWVDLTIIRDDNGKTLYRVATVQDISERKRAEEALRLQSEITAHAAEGVALIKSDKSTIFYTNRKFENLFGYDHDELIGKQITILNAETEKSSGEIADSIGQYLDKNGKWSGEVLSKRKDGTTFWSFASVSTFQHPDYGQLWMTYQSDISERKYIEENLRKAKYDAERAVKAKSKFLASVSHDLRQPLSALTLFVDMLRDMPEQSNDHILAKIESCVSSLNEMLTELLEFSRLEAGVINPKVFDFDLDNVLKNIASSHAPEAIQKNLVLRYRESGLIVRTDPVLLQRIVGNLLSNAVRYTARGGILVGCRSHQGKKWIEVWDTGIGIPPDKITEIFDEFRQLGNEERNPVKGAGLGLTIVAKTAELLGLQIRVRSWPDRGSMFAIEIPPGEKVMPVFKKKYRHKPLNIALVEDNAGVAEALAIALRKVGHRVIHGFSLTEVLPLLAEFIPDIVISDYRLAEGNNGYDVIRSVRTVVGAEVPALIITGDTDPAIIRDMSSKQIPVLHKPIDLEVLREKMAELTA